MSADAAYTHVSPLTAPNGYYTTYLNNDALNTYDIIASKFVAALPDDDGTLNTLTLTSSSNMLIEAFDSIKMFVNSDEANVKLYKSTLDAAANRTDTLFMNMYNPSAGLAVIESSGSQGKVWIKGTDSYQTVQLNDVTFKNDTVLNKLRLSTQKSAFQFDNEVIMKHNLSVPNITVGNDVAIGNNLIVQGSIFGNNINVWKEVNDLTNADKVGFGFNINAKNQLELIKYTHFTNGSVVTKITKKVAIFGHNSIQENDTDDASYLVFDAVAGFTAVGTGAGSGNVPTAGGGTSTDSIFTVNPDGAITYDSGYFGLGTSSPEYQLDVNGTTQTIELLATEATITNMHADNIYSPNVVTTSDARLKEINFSLDEEICLDTIMNLDIYNFKYINKPEVNRIGFIAQQVESVLPEAVSTDKYNGIDDCRFIDPVSILATLVGAVKKLNNMVTELQK
jgi:hypothetical protein